MNTVILTDQEFEYLRELLQREILTCVMRSGIQMTTIIASS